MRLILEKAFDNNVKWLKMFQVLEEIVQYRNTSLIWNLYKNETAVVKIGNEQDAEIWKGVKQGCDVSHNF